MYQVRFYQGDYEERQQRANQDGCVAYLEHHFNSSDNPATAHTEVLVAGNASERSRAWGRDYAQAVAAAFGCPLGGRERDGLMVLHDGDRGVGNIERTAMPAILVEPLFVSNLEQAALIRSEEGQELLAQCLVQSVRAHFPQGGLIGFSVGHKYKTSAPRDRGAPLVGPGGGEEADYAERVLLRARDLLVSG